MVQLTYTLAEAGADSEQQVFGKAERVHIHLLDQDKQLKHERLLFSLRPTSVTQDEHMRFRKGLFWLRLLFTPVHVYLSLLCLWIRTMTSLVRTVETSTPIAADPDEVFALIIDLPGYNDWLPHSAAYKGTTEISGNPLTVGSKYVERSPSGTRQGEVVQLDHAQRHVAFKQPMRLIPGLTIQIRVDMKVNEVGGEGSTDVRAVSCVVDRTVALQFPWYMLPVAGVITGQFEEEIKRTMTEMKNHCEKRAKAEDT